MISKQTDYFYIIFLAKKRDFTIFTKITLFELFLAILALLVAYWEPHYEMCKKRQNDQKWPFLAIF